MLQEKKKKEVEYDNDFKNREQEYRSEVEELQRQQNAKIRTEIERYEKLVREKEEQNNKWDKQNTLLIQSHDTFIDEGTSSYEKQIIDEQKGRQVLHVPSCICIYIYTYAIFMYV